MQLTSCDMFAKNSLLPLTPICQLCHLMHSSILLNTIPQIEHHLVDLRLQGIHLSTRLDSDETRKVAVHSCGRDLHEPTYLGG